MALFRIVLLLALSYGCSRPLEAHLLEIHEIGPDRVHPGQRIVIEGAGFPTGRDARVEFRGHFRRPALSPRTIELDFPGRAVSEHRIEVPMTEAVFREFGGRGTFQGTLQIAFDTGAFDTAFEGGRVVGWSASTLIDLLPATSSDSGSSLGPTIGLDLEAPDGEEPGVGIAAVAPGSVAANAGLAPADRIVRLEGVRVFSASDIAVSNDAHSASFVVERDGELHNVSIPLEGMQRDAERRFVRLAQLAVLLGFLALLWYGPGAWFDRLAPRPDAKRRAVPWLEIALAFLFSMLIHQGIAHFPLLGFDTVCLAIVCGRTSVLVLAAPTSRARLEAGARGVVSLLALLGMLAIVTLSLGTTHLAALEHARESSPSEWIAFHQPSGPLALLLVAVAAAAGPRALDWRVRALDEVFVTGLAASAVIAVSGISSAFFVLETTLGAVLLGRVRDWGASTNTFILVASAIALTLVSVTGTLGWLELDLSPALKRAIVEVLSLATLAVGIRWIGARAPQPARPLHPLL